jgi:hypothetical protein
MGYTPYVSAGLAGADTLKPWRTKMKTILIYELTYDRDAGDWYGHAELVMALPTGKPDWKSKPLNSVREMQAASREELRAVLDHCTETWAHARDAKRVELVNG